MSDTENDDSDHTTRVLYRTQLAPTAYECADCGETATTPRGFSERCEDAESDQ